MTRRGGEVVDLKDVRSKTPAPTDDASEVLAAMNEQYAVVVVGDKTLILREGTGSDGLFEVRFLLVNAFRQLLSNQRIRAGNGGDKSVAELWLDWAGRRTYMGLTFAPGEDTGDYYNLWTGFTVEPAAGDCGLFLDHVRVNVCGEDPSLFRWVMGWFAQMVQRPKEKPGTALVLRGSQGVGKTKVGEVIGSLFPRHYALVDDPRYITGNFNSHMAQCILLQADEGFWAGDKTAEGRLKGLVTSSWQFIEKKGVDPIRVPNLVRLLITSNNDWVVPAGKDERRFCVLDVGEFAKQNSEYFAAIDRQLADGGRAALLRYLLDFDLASVDLRKIPHTAALDEQKLASFDPATAWWYERLQDGSEVRSAAEWAGDVDKQELYGDFVAYCDRVGIKRRPAEALFGKALRKMVPGLQETRPRGVDGTRQRRVLFPALEACREHFMDLYCLQEEWPSHE